MKKDIIVSASSFFVTVVVAVITLFMIVKFHNNPEAFGQNQQQPQYQIHIYSGGQKIGQHIVNDYVFANGHISFKDLAGVRYFYSADVKIDYIGN
jgi:hypothetical protein